MTAREKKDLGLSKLDKDGLRFETFKKLHYLWLDYMREIIDFGKIETSDTMLQQGRSLLTEDRSLLRGNRSLLREDRSLLRHGQRLLQMPAAETG